MSRLAAVYLSELRFEKFDDLKDASQSCLTQSIPQEPVNLHSIKNRIHNMMFIHYAQESVNMTSWNLGHINFQVFPELRPLDLIRMLTARFTTFSKNWRSVQNLKHLCYEILNFTFNEK